MNRSFLGITANWFDAESLVRKSAAIAIQRFKGKHSFDKITGAISQTHARFGIESKVIMTCTDSGSNMVKAFGEFTRKNQTTVNESSGDNNEVRDQSASTTPRHLRFSSRKPVEAQKKQKKIFDYRARDRVFKSGDKVLLLLPTDENKLLMHWKGPFKVLERVNERDYLVQLPTKSSLVFCTSSQKVL